MEIKDWIGTIKAQKIKPGFSLEVKRVMKSYAIQKCREQRILLAKALGYKKEDNEYKTIVDNSPLPKFE